MRWSERDAANIHQPMDDTTSENRDLKSSAPSLERKAELGSIAYEIAIFLKEKGISGSERCLVREMTELLLRDC